MKTLCIRCNKPNKKNAKLFCSQSCSSQNIITTRINKWLSGEWDGCDNGKLKNTSTVIRTYLLEKANYKCSKCSWSEVNLTSKKIPLTLEHKDGNHLNNKPNNLEILCPNCHSLTPTYGGLNRGNGRQNRYNASIV